MMGVLQLLGQKSEFIRFFKQEIDIPLIVLFHLMIHMESVFAHFSKPTHGKSHRYSY